MFKELRPALVLFAALTLVTGVVYPAVVTAFAQGFFRSEAQGSLILREGKPIGSALLGQAFAEPRYFWGRPSATGPQPNNGAVSSGSNLGATNPKLEAAVRARIDALRSADPGNTLAIPVDLVTASASGLDPHISPAAAAYQIGRVARARGRTEADIRPLIAAATTGRTLGLLGEVRVNVLQLNLALDAQTSR